MKGADLEGIAFRHPLYERDSIGVLGEYVTLEQGTGAVHTAPGHGADDFLTGVKYGLEIYAPIGPGGHFLDDGGALRRRARVRRQPEGGRGAAPRARGSGTARSSQHQYPHCWRCHNPVIFLATSQWFVRMDGEPAITCEDGERRTLRRGRAARHRPPGEVDPALGPRPHLQHGDEPPRLVHLAPARLGRADSGGGLHVVRRGGAHAGARAIAPRRSSTLHGADAWYERPIEEFLPDGLAVPDVRRHLVRARAGHPRRVVRLGLEPRGGAAALRPPRLALRRCISRAATSTAAGSRARCWWRWPPAGARPSAQVLTHGFLIDLEGRKMSKSVGNAIAPQDVIKESGAEIIRLWVAMTEFTEELRVSKEILTRVVDFYRKLRNTVPHPGRQPLRLRSGHRHGAGRADGRSGPLRAGALRRRRARACSRRTTSTTSPPSSQALNTLVTVDLSAFYVDVTKDRMYTLGARVARAALDADGDVHHLRRPGAPAGAHPPGDRRRSVAPSARAAPRVGAPRVVPAVDRFADAPLASAGTPC